MDSQPQRLAPWPKDRPPLSLEDAHARLGALHADWSLDGSQLVRRIRTRDFSTSLALAVRAGELADLADHHPDLLVRWGELSIRLWTHSAGGLTDLDFTLARWLDQRLESGPEGT
jgi:4a-hydroxytetrahydrobiopterin dehydratase